MFNLDERKMKSALILGILFFVLSHPYLYRLLNRNLSGFVTFLDVDGSPTEIGVLVMALVFVAIVYCCNDQVSVKVSNNSNNSNSNGNAILNKCRTYCQQVTNEMAQEEALMNNIANTNNNVLNNGNVNSNINNIRLNNVPVNNNNVMVNNRVPAVSNQIPNNIAVANNIQMNQERMNNAMMNNQLQNNVAQAPIPSLNLNNVNAGNNLNLGNNFNAGNNLNNASNLGMDNLNNLNTGSTDMGLLNSQSCSDNPQCSGNVNSLVGGQVYDANLSNVGQGGMFSENTTYHDEMYASLF